MKCRSKNKFKVMREYRDFLFIVEKNKKSSRIDSLLKYAHILGWNYSLLSSPIISTAVWNCILPKKLKIGYDTFVDKGFTPDDLPTSDAEYVAQMQGQGTKYNDQNYTAFWEWQLYRPYTSPIWIQKNSKKYTEQNTTNRYGYGNDQYHGD